MLGSSELGHVCVGQQRTRLGSSFWWVGVPGQKQRMRTGTDSLLLLLDKNTYPPHPRKPLSSLCPSPHRVKEVYRLEEMEKIFVR